MSFQMIMCHSPLF
ncbi:hypothetical protein D4764_0275600 [Takifugu flavidus]|uniref:Uncharacterized protein n=1 Tax=Takifugu flavidus TaxID=433684 RepID=A0A5C6MFT8_9TELE|nr:hypothetical protein D4764_0275600 [Takifugu flavidus]